MEGGAKKIESIQDQDPSKDISKISSRIHPSVSYKESRKVEPHDYGKELTAFEIEAFDQEFVIGLGNPVRTQEKYGVTYCPIYFVPSNKNQEKIQIGIYEYEKKRAVEYMDTDGDLDINLLVPLFYSFAENTISQIPSKTTDFLTKTPPKGVSKMESESGPELDEELEPEPEPESEPESEEDVFELSRKKSMQQDTKKSLGPTPESVPSGPFQIKRDAEIPPPLPKETKEDAINIKKQYNSGEHRSWIQDFTKNPNYEIIPVEANGDCFFATIRDAFKQIGYITTVTELRGILAKEITNDIYQENRKLFTDFKKTKNEYEEEMERLKRRNQELKNQYKLAPNQEERNRIREETEELRVHYKELTKWVQETDQMISSSMGDLSSIDTFEKYKDYLLTNAYWADEWAINTLERVLNTKMIIFSEAYYREGAVHSVLQCGSTDPIITKSGKFDPKYYIMVTHNGNHYNLLSYKNKRILTFPEIPYDVKTMIVNKCVERNAGIFYMIEDFRNFKVELGIQADTGYPGDGESDDEYEMEESEDSGAASAAAATTPKEDSPASIDSIDKKPRSSSISKHDLYDSSVVFRFYNKSENTAMPGKGTGEQVPKDRVNDYKQLRSIANWRRKLDDQWIDQENPIEIDGSKYASVEHFIQSAKFRYKGANETTQKFAKMFTLENGEDISKDVNLAKAAGTTGKIKDATSKKMVILRPKDVTIDPDFTVSGREKRERMRALRAKFTQIPAMSILLKLTKRAKLVKYVPKQPPEIDAALMEVRRTIV